MFIRVRCFPVSIHDWQGPSLNDFDREFDRHFSKEKAMRRSHWKGKDTIFKRMDNHDYFQKVTMKMGIFVKSQYLSCMRSSLWSESWWCHIVIYCPCFIHCTIYMFLLLSWISQIKDSRIFMIFQQFCAHLLEYSRLIQSDLFSYVICHS